MLINSRAMGNFLDLILAAKFNISQVKKKEPEPVRAVDGSELTSGQIQYQNVPLTIVCENGHTKVLVFYLIDTPSFGAILGVPWLQDHNPQIDWALPLVTLDPSKRSEERRVGERV